MSVTPASSAAWIVAIERSSPGRPSIDMGIAPRPIAPTVMPPIVRLRISALLRVLLLSSKCNSVTDDVFPSASRLRRQVRGAQDLGQGGLGGLGVGLQGGEQVSQVHPVGLLGDLDDLGEGGRQRLGTWVFASLAGQRALGTGEVVGQDRE